MEKILGTCSYVKKIYIKLKDELKIETKNQPTSNTWNVFAFLHLGGKESTIKQDTYTCLLNGQTQSCQHHINNSKLCKASRNLVKTFTVSSIASTHDKSFVKTIPAKHVWGSCWWLNSKMYVFVKYRVKISSKTCLWKQKRDQIKVFYTFWKTTHSFPHLHTKCKSWN